MGYKTMIPVGSLCGAILQCLGVAMFCSSAILGFNESLRLFDNGSEGLMKDIDDNYVYYIEIGIYTWAAFMMLWAILFLFSAFMTTAQTSNQLRSENGNLCCSSRWCVGSALFFNCFVFVLWVFIMGAAVMPYTFSMMLSGYHYNETTITVDFKYYGLPIEEPIEIEELGKISENLIIFFALSVAGAALVVFGLANTIACIASNWVHMKVSDQWIDYASKRKQEERELHEMTSYKSSERLAQSLYY